MPGETSTVGDVTISDASGTTQVQTGEGTTITNWRQNGGANFLQKSAGTLTLLEVDGGTLNTEGVFVITTANVRSGTLRMNHTSGSVSITTLNHDGGTVNTVGSSEARTITTYNPTPGSSLVSDGNTLTITNYNEPSEPFTYTMT